MPTFEYNSSFLNFEVKGEGSPLIFLHGWGHSSSIFKDIANNLEKSYKCYLLDLPGFGSSSLPPSNWDSNNYAHVIIKFIEGMKLDIPAIIGHSFGGKIAAMVAYKNPGLINKLVLIDSAGIKPPMTVVKFLKIYLFKFARTIKKSGIFFKFGDILYNKIERFSGSADYLDAGEMQEILKRVVREDISSQLKGVKCRTLLLWGEEDDATPLQDAYKMKDLISNSELILFPNLGHHLPMESPHQVAHHIKDFLG